MTPTADHEKPQEEMFWSFEDLALFVGAVFPALAGALLIVQPFHFPNLGVQTLVYQCSFYALLIGALYLLISWRYRRPFWRSLGWTFEFRGAWVYLLLGPPLAIGLAKFADLLHASGNSAIPTLITDRSSLIAVVIFGALAGPVFEELVFRGFLQPLIAQHSRSWIGIVLTAIPFALLHGPGFGWAWQSVTIIWIAGMAMGFARYRAKSTAASTLLHIGYNSTLFAGFLLQRSL